MARRPSFENLSGTSRDVALEVLYNCLAEGQFAHKALTDACSRRRPDARARAAATEMAFGATRMKLALDWAIVKAAGRPESEIDPATMQILRLAEYQLSYMRDDARYAIVDTAVMQARKLTNQGASGFVNAVLRKLSSQGFDRCFPDRQKEPIRWLSVVKSHPEWIVSDWVGRFGFEQALIMCEYDNAAPTASIRVNRMKSGRQELAALLEDLGRKSQPGKLSAYSLSLEGWNDAASGELFEKGFYSIQDESSMLVAELLEPKAGMTVIDMCSAPGGKACHAAELSDDSAMIIAADSNAARLDLIRQNASRLGLSSVKPVLADASRMHETHKQAADRIIVDVPCSGLGVLARRPDSRWRKSKDEVKGFVELGASILDSAASCLKPGGRLAYSTCTICEDENELQVGSFLRRHPEFSVVPIRLLERQGISALGSGMAQLLGGMHGTDGFFIALLEKHPS